MTLPREWGEQEKAAVVNYELLRSLCQLQPVGAKALAHEVAHHFAGQHRSALGIKAARIQRQSKLGRDLAVLSGGGHDAIGI